MKGNEVVGGCIKHPGKSFLDCPSCKMEAFINKNKVTEDEDLDLSYQLVIMKAKQNDISPVNLMRFVKHFDKIKQIFL